LKALTSATRSSSIQKRRTGLCHSHEEDQRGSAPPDPTRGVIVTPAETSLRRQHVLGALREVIDPELGHNIVDLGLIYGLEVQDGVIKVTMTMTTPGCPAQDYILSGVRECCRRLPGIADARIEVVWDPPWSPHKMSATARAQSGIGG
ncbi:MAG: metal-sulfur cluster assembly factor, partial [Terriglobia bacterium]